MEKLLTAVFGEKCYFCGNVGRIVCYNCESKIRLCKSGVCIQCQKETVLGYTHVACTKEHSGELPSQLCAVYEYGGMMAGIIKKSKYNPKVFALLRLLSYTGAKAASKLGYDFTGFTVVPIPISRMRERERGFNQAEIIAKAVCKEFGLSVDNSILTRVRDTNKQFGLHKTERAQNIIGAFSVKGDVTGRKLLLVDDICTTGSTLMSCASELFNAGAKDVRCFTLSRKI